MILTDSTYKQWLIELKGKIRSVQIKAAIAVNSELIQFYWELGKMISEKQTSYGTGFIPQLSTDLKQEFPEMRGLSARNLAFCRQFYQFYAAANLQQTVAKFGQQPVVKSQNTDIQDNTPIQLPVEQKVQQLVAQVPWGHNILIFSKSKNVTEANFYIHQTMENNWSRDVLALQLKTELYIRNGKSITNFKNTLPEPLSDLAQQTLKDPYIFDFMALATGFKEKDIEKQLVEHITKFLLELGKGFAFVGQQYHLEVADNDYYIDLLFYHIKLKCYVVIELKNRKFIPEFGGKLNFYLSAVDTMVKEKDDGPTIGILLCRDKNGIEAEFALRDINKPMGVSEFQITEHLPDNLKSSLPTIEEIENEFKNLEQ
ncbi:putative nuclease of restriction endonuclease-like (RecB) superfamily [Pedobacter sp. UYP30]|uniref:PDDEXK nuclease domain-containing protein n=1 Tax=Pedobacter sp. UYP30 TaxID=1756400 RepID=UPI00339132CA